MEIKERIGVMRNKLDDVDLTSFVHKGYSGLQILYLEIIKQAAYDFLYFGLAEKGPSAYNHKSAYKYLYETHDSDFNTHYLISGLDNKYPIATFLDMLKEKRMVLTSTNSRLVKQYIKHSQDRALAKIKPGRQLELSLTNYPSSTIIVEGRRVTGILGPRKIKARIKRDSIDLIGLPIVLENI